MSRRKGIMLCYPLEEKRLSKWEPPFYCQPKLDGIRCRAIPHGDEYLLLTSEENIVFSMPHIESALNALKDVFGETEFDGELYSHGMPFETICSLVLRDGVHPNHLTIGFHIFDICHEGIPQAMRTAILNGLSTYFSPPLYQVPVEQCSTMLDVMESFNYYVFADYEGIIVRHKAGEYLRRRSTMIMKFKPKRIDTYPIVGWVEEISIDGIPKGRLGAVVLETDGQAFSVSAGLNDRQRAELWEIRDSLAGGSATVKYQSLTAKGIPKFHVDIEVFLCEERS